MKPQEAGGMAWAALYVIFIYENLIGAFFKYMNVI